MKKHAILPMIAGLLTAGAVAHAQPYQTLPGNAAYYGLHYIVPDVACWFNTVSQSVTNGYIDLTKAAGIADLGNWEPYTGVIGTSTFLVEFNTYANDGSLAYQNNAVALQPADGSPGKLVYAYHDDSGAPFKGIINYSRQNGNPGRAQGDRRPGATNYITECEVSVGQIPAFMTAPNRWNNNDIFQGTTIGSGNRYAASQVYGLDTSTLTPTPNLAWEHVYGPFVGSMGPTHNTGGEIERTGGSPVFLDNGNIVVMIDDKANIASVGNGESGECTTFAIIQPDGTTVKGYTFVDPNSIWDNIAAFKGGFCIRNGARMYFFDDSGNLTVSNNLALSTANLQAAAPNGYGATGNWDLGRGDGTRIGADINSPYVYLAGGIAGVGGVGPACMMAVWNGQTGAFLTNYMVSSDLDPAQLTVDRTSVAVYQDKICAVYNGVVQQGVGYAQQAIARVMEYNGSTLSYLTPSFFAFTNSDNVITVATNGFPNAFQSTAPNVSMTGDAICIAAKGYINSTNNPYSYVDSPSGNTTFYTVVSMPPTVSVTQSGGNATLSWPATAGNNYTLLSSSDLTAPRSSWAAVSPQPAINGPSNGQYSMTVAVGGANTYFALLAHKY
jgi:hypothetical protein